MEEKLCVRIEMSSEGQEGSNNKMPNNNNNNNRNKIRKNNTSRRVLTLLAQHGHKEARNALSAIPEMGHNSQFMASPIIKNGQGGKTRVMHAASIGDMARLRQLVKEYSTDIHSVESSSGMTALGYACLNGKLNAVKFLVENGADINGKYRDDKSPLILAVKGNHLQLVRFLCELGADLTIDNPLLNACRLEDVSPQIVEVLCEKGADVSFISRLYGSLLHAVIWDNKTGAEKAEILCRFNAPLEATFSLSEYTPLMAACTRNTDIVKVLCDCGANIEAKAGSWTTPLMIACTNTLAGAVTVLCEKGANKEAVDLYGFTALHFALRGNSSLAIYKDVLLELLNQGVNIQARDKGKTSPLDYAIELHNLKGVEVLCKYASDHGIDLVTQGDIDIAENELQLIRRGEWRNKWRNEDEYEDEDKDFIQKDEAKMVKIIETLRQYLPPVTKKIVGSKTKRVKWGFGGSGGSGGSNKNNWRSKRKTRRKMRVNEKNHGK